MAISMSRLDGPLPPFLNRLYVAASCVVLLALNAIIAVTHPGFFTMVVFLLDLIACVAGVIVIYRALNTSVPGTVP